MRTNTATTGMLMGAAAFAVGALSASAQTVYSVNVVGYVNTVIPGTDYANTANPGHAQYTLISNPLDNGSGNHIQDLFAAESVYGGVFPANAALGATAYYFNSSLQSFVGDLNNSYGTGWGNNVALPPGSGFFFLNGGKTFTNTFVGTVIQAPAITTIPMIPGYSLASSTFPVTGSFTNLGFNAYPGDTAYMFSQHGQSFVGILYNSYSATWPATPGFVVDPNAGPVLTNGISFFYLNTQVPHVTNFWSQTGSSFTVH